MPDNQSSQTARLFVLEEQAAHQQRVIEELSGQLAEQWRIVDQLRNTLEQLMARFIAIEEQSEAASRDTRPPHY